MVNHVTFLIPTINRFDLLENLLNQVKSQTRKPDQLVIVDNSNGKFSLPDSFPIKTQIVKADNIGYSGAVNVGYKKAKDFLIVCGDDDGISNDAVELFVKYANSNLDSIFFNPATLGPKGFGMFGVYAKKAIELIGYWDEAFYPAYYEDVDYARRMHIAGIEMCHIYEIVFHLGGIGFSRSSALKKASNQLAADMQSGIISNRNRYRRKWGGEPDQERYTVPFNCSF